MYGKHFKSAYTGSMYGAGADIFAVWGYVIAHTVKSSLEINPRMLAPILGMTIKRVQAAIDYLSAPDPDSRNTDSEGRRLVKDGAFQYFVPGWERYNKIKDEEARREYNRDKKRESRAKAAAALPKISKLDGLSADVKHCQTLSAQEEEEVEVEVLKTPEKAAERVLSELGIYWKELAAALTQICRLEMKQGRDATELRDQMVLAYRDFTACRQDLDFAPGDENFFRKGYWKDRSKWQFKEGKKPAPKRVYVNS